MSGRDTECIEYIDFFLIYLKNASDGRCVLCEKKFEADNLVFHHVYEITKVETISNLRKKGILYVLNELPKCVPLCISCHNRFTHTIEDETKIDHISKIKEWHSLYNRPGYLFGYPLNVVIAAAVIVHKEFVCRKTEGKKQTEQENLQE